MSDEIIIGAAARLGARDFSGAVQYVRDHRGELTDESRVPALLQAFYAARAGGDVGTARELAREIAVEEPEMPSIQRYLRTSGTR